MRSEEEIFEKACELDRIDNRLRMSGVIQLEILSWILNMRPYELLTKIYEYNRSQKTSIFTRLQGLTNPASSGKILLP